MPPNTVSKIKRIAICTGGGDAPGLNAVIRAATLAALNRGWEVYGIREHGFNGLLMPEQFLEGGLLHLTTTGYTVSPTWVAPSSAPPTAATRSHTRLKPPTVR